MRTTALVALAIACTALSPALRRADAQPAAVAPDLILYNGKVLTVDERFSVAEAVAIRGERIVAVGTAADC